MQALIFHEIGHIWHKPTGISIPRLGQRAKNSLAQLYQEGLAMVCEHILCQDDRYYHQNQNGWLDWCKENEAEKSVNISDASTKISARRISSGIGAATKITATWAIIWAASSSNICSGNRLSIAEASMSISYIIILRSLRRPNKRTASSKKALHRKSTYCSRRF